MPEEFQWLISRDNSAIGGTKKLALEDCYKMSDIAKMTIIRNESKNTFLAFKDRKEFIKWYEAIPEDEPRHYHEVIFGDLPQRIKFDIDAKAHLLNALPDTDQETTDDWDADELEILNDLIANEDPNEHKIIKIMKILIEAILDELFTAYYTSENMYPTLDDLIITESSGMDNGIQKYSFHIMTKNYFVADINEAKGFAMRVMDEIPKIYHQLIDTQVYKNIQNFRLLGSSKAGSDRIKRISTRFNTSTVTDALITAPIGARILSRIYSTEDSKKINVEVPSATIKAVLDVAEKQGILMGFSYKETRGNLLCFMRTMPSYCRICQEIHHKDNSLMISINDGEIKEHCRQSRNTLDVGFIDIPTTDIKKSIITQKSKIDPIITLINDIKESRINPHDSLASLFELLPDANIYSEDKMRDFELKPTLAVLAQMKLGKTKATRKFINDHFPANSLDKKVIRFVTFRQTFSASIAKDFPDFISYKDITGNIYQAKNPRVIIQVESLYRLHMDSYPESIDLLVLDEVESILAQFSSGLHKYFGASYAMFEWMMQTAKHVLVMDANLSDRTYNTLIRMRPDYPIQFHWNKFARAAGDIYEFTSNQGAWLNKLYDELKADKKIVIPANSLTEAKAICDDIKTNFPNKEIMLYSSETSASEKSRHFGDVHNHWNGLDVLIFTPTCSAGVSFELEHYDILFGYFCDKSCDVETCRQMLGRVRNLRERKHYICLRSFSSYLPTTVEDIRRLIYNKRSGLYKKCDGLQFSYAADGEIIFYESSFFHLWLETEKIKNLSLNDFTKRFINQVADTGATIEILEITDMELAKSLANQHQTTKELIKEIKCESVANANGITAEEAMAIRETMQMQNDVNPELKLSLEKFRLCELYSWHGRPMDTQWVSNYSKMESKRVYRSLIAITSAQTIDESLKNILDSEVGHYDYVISKRNILSESNDLLRDKYIYVHFAHSIAIKFLKICGFNCIMAKNLIHEKHIEARIRSVLPALINLIPQLSSEFELPVSLIRAVKSNIREIDTKKFISGMLRLINSIIRDLYGIQISRKGATYQLTQNNIGKLFIFSSDPDPDDRIGGIRPHIDSKLIINNQFDLVNYFIELAFIENEEDYSNE